MSETEQRGDFQSREEAERRDRALALERRRELTDAFLRLFGISRYLQVIDL